ncbi:hypothetical protein BV394_12270 [Brevirhabdus pacifica]|uniref:Uncharacterized protein n=1 Tax=Brevirhabdus pacifica TaxID=1267768 RepID=A0A1U7DKJ8_9RHOB|nr:divalent cation tolerance protein CutA [Brevirhabdus pacifica]APX90409.1 hypothetical protein BV394_12270 [Brevirhabdus pacifica]PJJ85500.1 divalent cation tolerance protein [Brevirhabdus pacifica]
MPRLALVTVTCPDVGSARALARRALEARLTACVSLAGPVQSLFHWQGTVETETETELHCKTTPACAPALAALLRRHHPYELPVILTVMAEVDDETLAWAEAETRGDAGEDPVEDPGP